MCGINYPPVRDFLVCPIHNEQTDPDPTHDPDPNWRERAQQLYKELTRRGEEDERPFPKVEGVPVLEEHELLWVDQSDLIRGGLRLPLGGCFQLFELDGAIYETQGWDEPRRRWWVEKVADVEQA